MAWLTEPDRTTSVALVALGVVFYLFFMYREIYAIISKLPSDDNKQRGYTTCLDTVINFICCCSYCYRCCRRCCYYSCCRCCYHHCCGKIKLKKVNEDEDDPPFQLQAFCFALMCGVFIIGPACLILAVFFLLPIPAIELAINLQSLLQIVIVVSAALISFKILTLGESKQKRFFRKFRHWYYTKSTNRKDEERGEDIYEDSGEIAGQLAQVVVDHLNPQE